jgi:hypothetical protein
MTGDGKLGESLSVAYARAKIQGRMEGKAESLEYVLVRRFGPMDEHARARIRSAHMEELDLWIELVLDAPSLDAVLGA